MIQGRVDAERGVAAALAQCAREALEAARGLVETVFGQIAKEQGVHA